MPAATRLLLISLAAAPSFAAAREPRITRGIVGRHRQQALLQTWGKELDGSVSSASETPVTRVVNLLKDMSKTLGQEMTEDAQLHEEMECWCNTGRYEKVEAIKEGNARIAELQASKEENSAKSAELRENLKELAAGIATDKESLAKATALRQSEVQVFQSLETDHTQAIENLKAAIAVLGKQHEAAFPQLVASPAFLQVQSQARSRRGFAWTSHEDDRSLDMFMDHNGYNEEDVDPLSIDKDSQQFIASATVPPTTTPTPTTAAPSTAAPDSSDLPDAADPPATPAAPTASLWSTSDVATVRTAMQTAAAFMQEAGDQRRDLNDYNPSYEAQSGEILGILEQMQENMEEDLRDAQQNEQKSAASFSTLQASKTQEIAAAERLSEDKEAELADADIGASSAGGDLQRTERTVQEDQAFLVNLEKMCTEGDANFEKRKGARLEEIKAVGETIEILTDDEARDAMSGTFSSFLQVSASTSHQSARKRAAVLLRRVALKGPNASRVAMLATSIELDAFSRVKRAVGRMIDMLRTQQEDEVKKHDYCQHELHQNEDETTKAEDSKTDLEAKVGELENALSTLQKEIEEAKAAIQQAQVELQRASANRQTENLDYQRTAADQTTTIEVLHKALDQLSAFYHSEFAQVGRSSQQHDAKAAAVRAAVRQAPPAQAKYKANEGAGGVMSMIEKLISDAKELLSDARRSEAQAQEAYEGLNDDTNGAVEALSREVSEKAGAISKAQKRFIITQSDLADGVKHLEGLKGEDSDLHRECDYIIANFQVRQEGRGEEIHSLQQAMSILSGADLREVMGN